MKKVKRIVNIIVAGLVLELPFIFPSSELIICIYTIGLVTSCVAVFKIMEKFNK